MNKFLGCPWHPTKLPNVSVIRAGHRDEPIIQVKLYCPQCETARFYTALEDEVQANYNRYTDNQKLINAVMPKLLKMWNTRSARFKISYTDPKSGKPIVEEKEFEDCAYISARAGGKLCLHRGGQKHIHSHGAEDKMMWRGRELTGDSWLRYLGEVHRAGDIDSRDPHKRTHLQFIMFCPETRWYSWPTTEELIKHFGAQHDVARPRAD